jgi:uncharacterized protein (DUF1800 family)
MKLNFLHLIRLSTTVLGLHALTVSASPLVLDQPMSETQAKAMLARFGYGPTPETLSGTAGKTPRQFLDRAIAQGSTLPPEVATALDALDRGSLESLWSSYGPGGSAFSPSVAPAERLKGRRKISENGSAQVKARLLVMANGDNPGHEALLSFWLNHFSVFAGKGPNDLLVDDYVRSLAEAMRTDSFEALLRASFFHPAMQIYLDNQQSVAPDSQAARQAKRSGRQPGINENLARELLELHTLGVNGGYEQQDVQELARIITGAGIFRADASAEKLAQAGAVRRGYFLFDPRRHDFGSKRFLDTDFPDGKGLAEIERALHLMATHPSTAKHIATKLAQRFLADEPADEVVAAMADAFQASGGRISTTLFALVESPDFQASLKAPKKFKEPLDYVMSVARAACGDNPITNAQALLVAARMMGQLPMRRSTPDGYGTQETDWLSPIAMAKRIRFANGVASGKVSFAAKATEDSQNPKGEQKSACKADPQRIEAMLGATRMNTLRSLVGLSPAEQSTVLLTSPEFMRR